MNIANTHTIYFLGIGGIGMSAMARYFHALGKMVCGYDKTPTHLTDQLRMEGITIDFTEDITLIPPHVDLAIYTPAVPEDHPAFQHFTDHGVPVRKRAEILGLLTQDQFTVAVAGTHGKTTITSLITHLLKRAGKPVTAFIGGIYKNDNSNLVMSEKSRFMVVEADEFDRSFLNLYPDIAVITSIDADHLDIYIHRDKLLESFCTFATQVKSHGKVFLKKGLPIHIKAGTDIKHYSVTEEADIGIISHSIRNGFQQFDLKAGERIIRDLSIVLPGLYNIENAIVASAVALELGIDEMQLRKGLGSFRGVERRFDIRIQAPEIIFIDDYAHHPEEISACISGVRDFFPGKKVTGIFQPHLYSRTRDLAKEFALSLEKLDEIILLDIYPAREQPIKGVSSKMIFDRIRKSNKTMARRNDLFNMLQERNLEIVLTLGAGDIDQLVQPIENLLKSKYTDQAK
ncbi:MAG: UDP-N-acetylmuramate--L-alanine ligase [Bacteroidetes bacterium]|nr:UDP-N-acetylmuramate--L-alanine ligase [Bacteroidota bacterium]